MSDLQKRLESFELNNATAPMFQSLEQEFWAEVKEQPLEQLQLTAGWHTATPELALSWLKRNRKNRHVSFRRLCYYATQMTQDAWKETGQPIIFTSDGELLDGQHRLWAIALSHRSIRIYVIADVPAQKDLFAYVDDVSPRSPQDAMQTAGMNGLARHIKSAIKVLQQWDSGNLDRKRRNARAMFISPVQYLTAARESETVRTVTEVLYNHHASVVRSYGKPDGVLTALCAKVYENCGMETLDNFLKEFVRPDLTDTSAIEALSRYYELAGKKQLPISVRHALALLVKTFNYWINNRPVRKLGYDPNDDLEAVTEVIAEAA